MTANDKIPADLAEFLLSAGISERSIARSSLHTGLYEDLGLYGDTAWWFVEELIDRGVDMTSFNFDRYFPPEVFGETWGARWFYAMIPFVNRAKRKQKAYKPVTLEAVMRSLRDGVWYDPQKGG